MQPTTFIEYLIQGVCDSINNSRLSIAKPPLWTNLIMDDVVNIPPWTWLLALFHLPMNSTQQYVYRRRSREI